MEARPVDPRDTEWEIGSPLYRVHLWRRRGNGWESEEFELRDARDVREVVEWAEAAASSDRRFTVYALVDHVGGRGLVYLLGVDPTAAPCED